MAGADLCVLVSPHAGRGRSSRFGKDVIDELSNQSGKQVHDLTGATAQESITAIIDMLPHMERLVVVGGDGTVHAAVHALAGSDVALGVIPFGTANDFALSTTASTLDTADLSAHVAASLQPANPIDLIAVATPASDEPTWVASVATGGFSGRVNQRANQLRYPKGSLRYTVATVLELPRFALQPATITVDGQSYGHNLGLYAAGNTEAFGGKMKICPAASPTDGLIDLTVVADVGRVELARFFNRVFSGTHMAHPRVHHYRGQTITIGTRDSNGLNCWADGEPISDSTSEVTLRAVPGALRLAGMPSA